MKDSALEIILTSGAGKTLSSTLGTWSGVKAQTQCDCYLHSLKLPLFGLSLSLSKGKNRKYTGGISSSIV